jgi:hypothetical protein
MNSEELKQQLHTYRPSADSEGSLHAAAQQLQKDPELNSWLEREQEFDRLFARQVRSVPVPADLRERILSQASVRGSLLDTTPPAVAASGRRPKNWLHLSFFTGSGVLAASIALFFTFFFNPSASKVSPELKALISESNFMQQSPVDLQLLDDYNSMLQLIASTGGAIPSFLPAMLSADQSFGCSTVRLQDQMVGLLCFRVDDATYHLFTIDRTGMPQQEDLPKPVFASYPGFSSATWTCRRNIYVLASPTDVSSIRQQMAQLR